MTKSTIRTAANNSLHAQGASPETLHVKRARTPEEMKQVFGIRKRVFVEEQHVREEDEYDEFEKEARHFIAFIGETPCGAARWRITGEGVKLERFAVLQDYRRKGVGAALLHAILNEVRILSAKPVIYLHAQLSALPLYEKFGFRRTGPLFEECGIQHYKMKLLEG